MGDEPTFSCRDTEIVLQMLRLTQQIEQGHGVHAIRHVISCPECTAKGYSGISQKTIGCEQAVRIWVQTPHVLKRPQTLEQCLALEHFWLKPCTVWICTQIREHIAPLRLHAETVMNELGEIITHCTDFAVTATKDALAQGQILFDNTYRRAWEFLDDIRRNPTK